MEPADPGRSRYAALVLALALAPLLATPVAAQDWSGRGRLQGSVSGPSGQPIQGAKITLRLKDDPNAGPPPLTTNKKGKWSYLGLVTGVWKVSIEAPGYVPSEGVVHVNEFGAAEDVNIQLNPISETEKKASAEDEAVAAIGRGNALLQQKKWAEARAEFETALPKLDPSQQPAVLRGIAHTWSAEGKTDEAVATLKKALEIKPDDADSLKLIINLLVAADREEEAKAYMDRLPQGATIDPTTALNVGIDLYNKQDLDGALVQFNRVVEENPDLPDGYYYRGLVYLNKGQNAPAIADFKKLLDLAPDYPQAAEVQQFLDYLEKPQK